MTVASKLMYSEAAKVTDDESLLEGCQKMYHAHQRTLSETTTDTKATVSASVSSETSSMAEGQVDDQLTTVDLFPYDTSVEDLEEVGYTNIKKVHWIRHAQGYHNLDDGTNAKSRCCIDARLTPKGIMQCRGLAKAIETAPPGSILHDVLEDTELIVTSPVTRCVQTALHSFQPVLDKNPGLPVVANDSIRETVNFNCDRRRPICEIANDFPQVDFTQACPHEEDNIWEYYLTQLGDDEEFVENRESAEIYKVADRCREFFTQWLRFRPETNICVCAHATVSRCIFNFGLGTDTKKTPTDVEQVLDTRDADELFDVPVVNFGYHEELEDYIRQDFKNCELRSMIVAYK